MKLENVKAGAWVAQSAKDQCFQGSMETVLACCFVKIYSCVGCEAYIKDADPREAVFGYGCDSRQAFVDLMGKVGQV